MVSRFRGLEVHIRVRAWLGSGEDSSPTGTSQSLPRCVSVLGEGGRRVSVLRVGRGEEETAAGVCLSSSYQATSAIRLGLHSYDLT